MSKNANLVWSEPQVKWSRDHVESRNAFAMRVLKIEDETILVEWRVGVQKPTRVTLSEDDVLLGHFLAYRER